MTFFTLVFTEQVCVYVCVRVRACACVHMCVCVRSLLVLSTPGHRCSKSHIPNACGPPALKAHSMKCPKKLIWLLFKII